MAPLRTASMKPTSKMGTVAVRRNCENGALGRGRPSAAQVRDGRSSQPNNERVQQPRRQVLERDPHQLGRETLGVAPQDVRWRTHRNTNPSSAALGQIDGNLGAAVPRADNQHALAAKGPRIAVINRMNHRPIKHTGPSADMARGYSRWPPQPPAQESCRQRSGPPMAVITVNPGGLDTKLAARGDDAPRTAPGIAQTDRAPPSGRTHGESGSPEVRQPANGVQMQPVIAGPPLLPTCSPRSRMMGLCHPPATPPPPPIPPDQHRRRRPRPPAKATAG